MLSVKVALEGLKIVRQGQGRRGKRFTRNHIYIVKRIGECVVRFVFNFTTKVGHV